MTAEEKMSRAFLVVIGAFVALFIIVVGLVVFSVSKALAQDHSGHRPQDMDLHDKFYRTWMMPENRSISCCHDQDCKPALSYQKDGKWFAKQEDDSREYTQIPPQKIEQERDSPDGRSHLCGRRYFFSGEFTVFCFLPAGGT